MLKNLATAVAALALVAGLFLASASVRAEKLPEAKIAVLDFQRVLRDSAAGKDIRRQIESYRKAYQTEIKKEEATLRKTENELKTQRAVLASDVFQKRRQEFEDRVISLQRRVRDRTRALDKAYSDAMRKLREPLLPLVKEMTKQLGYNIVVDNAQVLVVLKGMDITDMVIERLNKKVPKIKVPKPTSKS